MQAWQQYINVGDCSHIVLSPHGCQRHVLVSVQGLCVCSSLWLSTCVAWQTLHPVILNATTWVSTHMSCCPSRYLGYRCIAWVAKRLGLKTLSAKQCKVFSPSVATRVSTSCVGVHAGTLSRTNRTPRQQLQNKQAQQRYRERRKMKVTEMEQALGAMSQQVDELQGVLKQNVALQVQSLSSTLNQLGAIV